MIALRIKEEDGYLCFDNYRQAVEYLKMLTIPQEYTKGQHKRSTNIMYKKAVQRRAKTMHNKIIRVLSDRDFIEDLVKTQDLYSVKERKGR